MIAVVTGSSGFIGSHLVDALLARGDTVRALVREDSPALPAHLRVQRSVVDLLDDRSVRDADVWEGASHVFHCAGVTKRRTLAQFRAGNVIPTANVLAAAAARGGTSPPRVIVVSSQAAAGPARAPDRPVREEDAAAPVEAYGQSKLEAETAAHIYDDRLAITIVRPGAVYGPRDRDFLGVFRLASRPIALHVVPRQQAFSIVHVTCVVNALLAAAEHPSAAGRTYFVANQQPTTWAALYADIARAASVQRRFELQLPLRALALAGAVGDVVSALTGWHSLANSNKTKLAQPHWWLCDSSRASAELGWHPSIPLQQGVGDTYLWYLRAGWMRARQPRSAVPSEEPQA